MLGCVGSPRAPGLGAVEKAGGCRADAVEYGSPAEQADVRCGEGVHLADGAESDVLGGPFADAADGAEACDGLVDGSERAEEIGVGDSSLG